MKTAATTARANNLLLLGVTVLTSATEETLHEIGVPGRVDDGFVRENGIAIEGRRSKQQKSDKTAYAPRRDAGPDPWGIAHKIVRRP